MNIFKRIYCRVFQTVFRAALPLLPYREPDILGSVSEVAPLLGKLNIRSVMLVTDAGIRGMGITAELERSLADAGIILTVYDGTQPNPTVKNVEEARELYLREGCQALIAFGGGSSIDCAKALGARIAYPKRELNKLKGVMRVLRKIPTLIAIPTTAGTGSEVTLAAVITDSEQQHKYAMMDFTLIPHYAVLDECVTLSLPPQLTATTGMDALTHATEAYIGRSTTRQTRRLAKEATRLIFENIEKAYRDGQDRSARKNMLSAAYKAGVAFSKSYVGYIHAIAHSLGGKYGTPHGLANAVIMPYVLEAYGKSVYKKLYRLALCAGVCDEGDSYETGAKKYIDAIRVLNFRMGIAGKISDIKDEDIPEMARHAEREANPLYPVPRLMTQRELEELYYRVGGIDGREEG